MEDAHHQPGPWVGVRVIPIATSCLKALKAAAGAELPGSTKAKAGLSRSPPVMHQRAKA